MGNDARRSFATALVERARGLGNLCRHQWACWRKKRLESPPSQNAAMSAFDGLLADAMEEGLIFDNERRRGLLRRCFEHIWQPADQASIGTTGQPSAVCDDWLIESLYAASTRVLQDVADPEDFTRVLGPHSYGKALRAGVAVCLDLSGLTDHAFALFKFSRSRFTNNISLDLHICTVVFALAQLRAHMGDRQRAGVPPVFTLVGPLQRDLQEKTAALTNSLADLHTVRAQLKRQIAVNNQQQAQIRGLEARNTELTKSIDHLRQELATLGTEPLQREAAAHTAKISSLTARLEEEQLTVLDLQQKLQVQQPKYDARMRAVEAVVEKQNDHIQYLKDELRNAGVAFNENWGVGRAP